MVEEVNEDEYCAYGAADEYDMSEINAMREAHQVQFKKLEKTKEYAERHYFTQKYIDENDTECLSRVPVN